jgi:hypothetical protein
VRFTVLPLSPLCLCVCVCVCVYQWPDSNVRVPGFLSAWVTVPKAGGWAWTPRAARARARAERAALRGVAWYWAAFKDWIRRVRERVRRAENPVWKGRMHDIEAQFGGAYASYFIFVRWLFLLNVGISIICIYLIVAIGIAHTTQQNQWSEIAIDFIPYIPAFVRRPRISPYTHTPTRAPAHTHTHTHTHTRAHPCTRMHTHARACTQGSERVRG